MSEIFCSPKILTYEVALNEKNCLFSLLITMINTVLCVVVTATLTVIINKKQRLHLRGYNLTLIFL